METHMKINGEKVRSLREARSWSQEHLANAAGLSARTIQRVEIEGTGSAETRLALAAALAVSVSTLIPEPAPIERVSRGAERERVWGWVVHGVGLLCALLAIGYSRPSGASTVEEAYRYHGVIGILKGADMTDRYIEEEPE